MQGRCLRHPIQRCSHGAIVVAGDIDAVKHLVQERGFLPGPHRVESFLQSVGQVIGLIDLELRVPLFPAESAEIADIHSHVAADTSRHRHGEVLHIGIHEIGCRNVHLLRPVR